MRVTNSTVLRNYDRNLRRLGKAKFDCEQNIYTGRKFSRASENPLNAAKALTIRKQLYHTDQYMENLDVAEKFYTEAETSLLQISEQLSSVREIIIYACNTTKEKDVDIQILAQQLETKAREMISVFNTDSAERAIFGGECNSAEPFTLEMGDDGFAKQILYHGVPVNAYKDCRDFPYSNDVLIDIGIGMVMDQDTQEVDPQSALRISFNGADVTGCGADKYNASIDLASMENTKKYSFDMYMANEKTTITFRAGATEAETQANINEALAAAYKDRGVPIPTVDAEGKITAGNETDGFEDIYIAVSEDTENKPTVANDYGFANNYLQITLDAANALKRGDIPYANACIDKIVTASQNLMIEIADLGNNEEFITFNKGRFETRELNLKERQDTLEATDLESEITLMKTYEALYNACLQMSSTIIPQTIFNYIR